MYDPLDKAVEKLWLNGVVVVTSVGNYATDGVQSSVLYAPANDPFVITVGASDTNGSGNTNDDFAAPWSAWGYTNDGFFKPELSAPGRVMNGPVPTTSTMITSHPERQVAPGYMWMSGTSFAAPVVSASADYVLAMHPNWTPDQVKGALMVSADPTPAATPHSLGFGEADMAKAADLLTAPPNPNAALNQFVVTGQDGSPVLDAAAWQSAAKSSAAWASAAWSDAAWSDAAWASAAWSDAAWSDAAWSDAAWSDAAWSDNAASDPAIGVAPTVIDPATKTALLQKLGLVAPAPTTTTSTVTSTTGGLLP
jgi:serine protease AprX